jgi:outer membrane immunogenic protein
MPPVNVEKYEDTMTKIILPVFISSIMVWSAIAEEPSPALSPSLSAAFNGFYIGGGITYSSGKINNNARYANGNNIVNVTARGAGFNGFFGYGTYFGGGFFLGAELGLGADGSRFGNKRAGTANFNNVSTAVRFKSKSNLNYGIAGRVGYIFSSVLPYIKVGFEGHGAVKLTTTDGTQLNYGGKAVNLRRNGLLVGGGVDYALMQNVFVRAEYTHNFGTRSRFNANGVKVAEFKTPTDTFLIGAGYRY